MNAPTPRFLPLPEPRDDHRLAPAPRPSGYRDSVRPRRTPGTGYGRSSGWARSHRYAEDGGEDFLRLG